MSKGAVEWKRDKANVIRTHLRPKQEAHVLLERVLLKLALEQLLARVQQIAIEVILRPRHVHLPTIRVGVPVHIRGGFAVC